MSSKTFKFSVSKALVRSSRVFTNELSKICIIWHTALNVNFHSGFYRVNYDTTLRENLASALKKDNFSGIHVTNRAQFVDDSYALARAGYLTFGQVLSNVEFLENETEYFTWYPATTLFNYLLQRTGTSQLLGARLTVRRLLCRTTDTTNFSKVLFNL